MAENPTHYDTTPTVDAIGQIHLEGNIIPHAWYQHIKTPAGAPDLPAIIVLAEIVYWYRPTYEMDEATGLLRSVRKKFRADKLQRSAKAIALKFGLTQRQVSDALARLEHQGLLKRERRTWTIGDVTAGNVPFIEPIASQVAVITHCRESFYVKPSDLLQFNVEAPTDKRSITYTTTKNSTETTNIPPPIPPPGKNRVRQKKHEKLRMDYTPGFLVWWDTYPHDRRIGKPQCFAVWAAHQLEVRTAELVEKIERLKMTNWDRPPEERKWIKTSLPYLNDGRFEDELVPLPVKELSAIERMVEEGYFDDRRRNESMRNVTPGWNARQDG